MLGENDAMDLLRSFARPALALSFIVDGVDAIVRPQRHVEKIEAVMPTLEKAGAPQLLTSDAVLLTRTSGAVSVVAGLGLATGRAPRASATILAAMNVPLAIVNNPVWLASSREERRDAVAGLARSCTIGAGLIFAALDRQGKPSLGWKHRNAQVQRQLIEAARREAADRATLKAERTAKIQALVQRVK